MSNTEKWLQELNDLEEQSNEVPLGKASTINGAIQERIDNLIRNNQEPELDPMTGRWTSYQILGGD